MAYAVIITPYGLHIPLPLPDARDVRITLNIDVPNARYRARATPTVHACRLSRFIRRVFILLVADPCVAVEATITPRTLVPSKAVRCLSAQAEVPNTRVPSFGVGLRTRQPYTHKRLEGVRTELVEIAAAGQLDTCCISASTITHRLVLTT